jgi:glutamate formiminotransferase / formiminotetrahydrofolate cyclodeaminase
VPLRVMEVSVQALEVAVLMAESGLAASASDAGVGALCARAAVRGAGLNVRINCPDLADPGERAEFLAAADAFVQRAAELETLALAAVDTNLA